MLYFSSNGNSNPNTNGRSYTVAWSNDLYFGERYAYSRDQVAQLLARLNFASGDLRGKRVLEVGRAAIWGSR